MGNENSAGDGTAESVEGQDLQKLAAFVQKGGLATTQSDDDGQTEGCIEIDEHTRRMTIIRENVYHYVGLVSGREYAKEMGLKVEYTELPQAPLEFLFPQKKKAENVDQNQPSETDEPIPSETGEENGELEKSESKRSSSGNVNKVDNNSANAVSEESDDLIETKQNSHKVLDQEKPGSDQKIEEGKNTEKRDNHSNESEGTDANSNAKEPVVLESEIAKNEEREALKPFLSSGDRDGEEVLKTEQSRGNDSENVIDETEDWSKVRPRHVLYDVKEDAEKTSPSNAKEETNTKEDSTKQSTEKKEVSHHQEPGDHIDAVEAERLQKSPSGKDTTDEANAVDKKVESVGDNETSSPGSSAEVEASGLSENKIEATVATKVTSAHVIENGVEASSAQSDTESAPLYSTVMTVGPKRKLEGPMRKASSEDDKSVAVGKAATETDESAKIATGKTDAGDHRRQPRTEDEGLDKNNIDSNVSNPDASATREKRNKASKIPTERRISSTIYVAPRRGSKDVMESNIPRPASVGKNDPINDSESWPEEKFKDGEAGDFQSGRTAEKEKLSHTESDELVVAKRDPLLEKPRKTYAYQVQTTDLVTGSSDPLKKRHVEGHKDVNLGSGKIVNTPSILMPTSITSSTNRQRCELISQGQPVKRPEKPSTAQTAEVTTRPPDLVSQESSASYLDNILTSHMVDDDTRNEVEVAMVKQTTAPLFQENSIKEHSTPGVIQTEDEGSRKEAAVEIGKLATAAPAGGELNDGSDVITMNKSTTTVFDDPDDSNSAASVSHSGPKTQRAVSMCDSFTQTVDAPDGSKPKGGILTRSRSVGFRFPDGTVERANESKGNTSPLSSPAKSPLTPIAERKALKVSSIPKSDSKTKIPLSSKPGFSNFQGQRSFSAPETSLSSKPSVHPSQGHRVSAAPDSASSSKSSLTHGYRSSAAPESASSSKSSLPHGYRSSPAPERKTIPPRKEALTKTAPSTSSASVGPPKTAHDITTKPHRHSSLPKAPSTGAGVPVIPPRAVPSPKVVRKKEGSKGGTPRQTVPSKSVEYIPRCTCLQISGKDPSRAFQSDNSRIPLGGRQKSCEALSHSTPDNPLGLREYGFAAPSKRPQWR